MENTADKTKSGLNIDGEGNYFVSNYPPYSFWSANAVPSTLNALTQQPDPAPPLGIYMHIPFCRQRCHFCYFKVYTGKSARDVDSYMQALATEAALFAKQARFSNRKPRFLYLGGGTPSYISQKQFTEFMNKLRGTFPLDAVEEFTLECEPGTISLEKLKAFKDAGVTRASLGIEHFNNEVLAVNNRAHNEKAIYSAFDNAKAAGFSQINVDLIAGMPGDSEDSWNEAVEKTIALAPESVTIYQLEFPYNTTFSKVFREEGALPVQAANWAAKRRWVRNAFENLEAAGYELTSGYTARLKDSTVSFIYRDALWAGADMLGLGVSAFSHIGGHHFQNEKDMNRYMASMESGKLALTRGYNLSPAESMIREFILQLKKGAVSLDYFLSKFDVDITDIFQEPLEALKTNQLITQSHEIITLSREALLQVDALLPAFFLPEHQTSRG